MSTNAMYLENNSQANERLRAVTYARVSKDDTGKDGRNLQGQLDMCREYAMTKGYQIVTDLAEDDRGASGAAWNLPMLSKALEMARNDEFDILIVRELDRFARGLAKQLVIEAEFRRSGVEIEYVLGEYPDTAEGQLNKNIRAVIAEYEREKIRERMTRGRFNKVKSGAVLLHGDQPPYGYRVSKDGKNLVVYEPEARIVRLVFTWYAIGDETGKKMGTRAIATRLTEMNIPTWKDTHQRGYKKRGYGKWASGTICGILSNETYIGNWYYGKKRGINNMNPLDKWIKVEVPPIITQELWDQAQAQKNYNKQMARRNVKKDYLVARRLRCGKCGNRMHARSAWTKDRKGKKKVYLYYICAARYGRIVGQKCNILNFRADQVDLLVWKHIKEVLTAPQKLAQGVQDYLENQEQANAPYRERLEVVNDLLGDHQKQLDRLLSLYLSGDFDKEILMERKYRLEETIKVLEREQASIMAHLEITDLTLNQVTYLQEHFSDKITLGADLAETTFEMRRQVIDTLDVTVTLAIEEGKKVVYVHHVLDTEGYGIMLPHESASNPHDSGPPSNGSTHNERIELQKTKQADKSILSIEEGNPVNTWPGRTFIP